MTINHNKFKIIYENLDKASVEHITKLREAAHILAELYTVNNAEMSLASINLEQSMMWAIRGICIASSANDEL
jgi:hypothetical protein